MLKTLNDFINCYGLQYRKYVFILIILSVFAGLMEMFAILLIFPLINMITYPNLIHAGGLMTRLYNLFDMQSDESFIAFVAMGLVFIFILKNLYMILVGFLEHKVICSWKKNICITLMQRFLYIPYLDYTKKESASFINALSQSIFAVMQQFIMSFMMLTTNVIIALLLFIFLLKQYFLITIFTTMALFTFLGLQRMYTKRATTLCAKKRLGLSIKNMDALQQSLGGFKMTKVLQREQFFLSEYQKTSAELADMERGLHFYEMLPPSTVEIAIMSSIIITCYILFTSGGDYGVADLAMLAGVVFRLSPVISRIFSTTVQIENAKPIAKKLINEWKELDSLRLEQDNSNKKRIILKDCITLKNTFFSYSGDEKYALSDISLQIKKGEFIGIVGQSGSGKSTLTNIFMGLLFPQQGEFKVDNTAISQDNIRDFRKTIGYVPQDTYITSKTIKQNIGFGYSDPEINEKRVIEVLKKAELWEFCQTLPKGLDTVLTESGRNLSGGQRQRLSIARALYKNPDILILDEATSALDVQTENAIALGIGNLKREKTIIAIAHRLSTLKKCDKVIYMDEGKILGIGTFAQLRKKFANFDEMIKLSQC